MTTRRKELTRTEQVEQAIALFESAVMQWCSRTNLGMDASEQMALYQKRLDELRAISLIAPSPAPGEAAITDAEVDVNERLDHVLQQVRFGVERWPDSPPMHGLRSALSAYDSALERAARQARATQGETANG